MVKTSVMKTIAGSPRSPLLRLSAPCQPLGWCVHPSRATAPVKSITRAEIDRFWGRKKQDEEERQLTAEKEAARIKAKTLTKEDYRLFEQRMKEIIEEGKDDDAKNSWKEPVVIKNSETRIGIKNWWTKSSYAYLNQPAITSMDDNNGCKNTITHISQKICFSFCSSAPFPTSTTGFVIF